MKGCATEKTGGAANSCRSLKKPGRMQRRKSKNEKHEMEVEIEKIVKAQNEAQSAVEVADIKWKLNSRSFVMLSSHSWTKPSSHQPQHAGPSARRIAGTEYHQQRTPQRSSSLSKSILNRSQRSDRQHRKPRTTRILRSRVVYPRIHSTT